jgi:hypothetical protein
MEEDKLIEYYLGLLGQIKLYHWSVMKYSKHVALDNLHSNLSDNIDKFVECYIGKYNKQPLPIFTINTTATSYTANIIGYLETQRENLKKIRNQFSKSTDLQNIIDEMTGNINQAVYLIKLE